MPTQVFFNLKEVKRDKIISSIKKEMSNYPIEDIQVKRIIEDASIARGSFYQYFYDVDDMYLYILRQKQDEIVDFQNSLLNNNPKDSFNSIKNAFKDRIKKSYNKSYEDVDFQIIHQIRKSDKAINFFLQSMGINEANKIVDMLLSTYPNIDSFHKSIIQEMLIPSLKITVKKLFKSEINIDIAINEIDTKFEIINTYIKKIESL